ncbi:hypothetical protein AAVH_17398 [Aphelenchoides avenae]|nr:hypothetical protein AAVH_17398 [Aphelenchus avenae]
MDDNDLLDDENVEGPGGGDYEHLQLPALPRPPTAVVVMMEAKEVKQRLLATTAIVVKQCTTKVGIPAEMARTRTAWRRWGMYSAVKAEILERLANEESKRVTKLVTGKLRKSG